MLEMMRNFLIHVQSIPSFFCWINRCDSGSGIWFYFSKARFLAENSVGFTNNFYEGQ